MVHIQSSSDSLFDRDVDDVEAQAIAGADDKLLSLLLRSLLGACITGSFVSKGGFIVSKTKVKIKVLNILLLSLIFG